METSLADLYIPPLILFPLDNSNFATQDLPPLKTLRAISELDAVQSRRYYDLYYPDTAMPGTVAECKGAICVAIGCWDWQTTSIPADDPDPDA